MIRSPESLRANQRLLSSILQENEAKMAILQMGGGKTAGTLDALYRLFADFSINHALIIAPWFVAKNTWPDEIEAWAHTRCLSYAVAVGDPEERAAAIAARREITTINFENLPWLAKHIKSINNWYWDTVVIDESPRLAAGEGRTKPTKVKTVKDGEIITKVRPGGNMTRFGIMTTARKKIDRVIELTGTPGDIRKLWGQSYLLDQGRALGRDKSVFEREFFNRDPYTKAIEEKPGAEAEVLRRMGNLAVTIPSEAVVPEPHFIPMKVRLPDSAMKQYREFERTMFSQDWDVEAVSRGVLANKLLQAANGAIYNEIKDVIPIHDEKVRALEELVEMANGESILTFYAFKFDKDRLKKRWPDAVVANEYRGDLVADWNKGRIKHLLAHPACLHPATEVLTEHRGWIPIVEVRATERVFDGEEFVSHSGCQYSGFKEVLEVFGVKMTADHQMLVSDEWMRAKDAVLDRGARAKARYTYAGNDPRLSALLALQSGVGIHTAELQQAQPHGSNPLSEVRGPDDAQNEPHPLLWGLERYERPLLQSQVKEPKELRWSGHRVVRKLANFCQFLRGYVGGLSRRFDDRESGRKQGLLEGQLHMGHFVRPAVQQAEQSQSALQRRDVTLGGTVSQNRTDQKQAEVSPGCGHGTGGSRAEGSGVELRDRSPRSKNESHGQASEMSHVYDLVDCGPRHRFVIRNAEGEVFVSHNSIGHGTNLQYGGHIAAWYGLTFSLELWLQANARLPRPGQTKQVLIYPIVAEGTYDERALHLLSEKNATQDRIINYFLQN